MSLARARGERGFTLIEIAIGIAVLGLGVVAALQVFGGSMRLVRNASRLTEAVVHARALMDAVLWAPALQDEESSGVIGDGYRWKRRVGLAEQADGLELNDDGDVFQTDVQLAKIEVTVQWDEPGGVKEYSIKTMRVVPNYAE